MQDGIVLFPLAVSHTEQIGDQALHPSACRAMGMDFIAVIIPLSLSPLKGYAPFDKVAPSKNDELLHIFHGTRCDVICDSGHWRVHRDWNR
jgi:hypothetical protein